MPPARKSDWAARGALVLLGAMLSLSVIRSGVASSLADADPLAAAGFAPGNARAAVAAAQARVAAGESAAASPADDLVQAALLRDTTLPGALELRAIAFETAGDDRRAARLFALSSAISRRSLPTRLWLIQRSVDRGDVAGALKEFDLALRTSSAAPEILFPVLAGATTDPGLVQPIARILDRPSDWRAMFLAYAINDGGAAQTTADVVLNMRDRAMIIGDEIDQALVGKLVEEQAFAKARRVHAAFGPGGPQSTLVRDPIFADPGARYPFGWGLIDTAEMGATRDTVAGRPALAFRAASGAEGPVATQLLGLEPGAYRLASSNAAAPADPLSPPYWTLTCAGEGVNQIALLELSDEDGNFIVPADCRAQWLALNVRGGDSQDGQAGAIRSIRIERR